MGARAGQLDTPIELQSAEQAVSDAGQASQAWTTYATVWAEMLPSPGSEFQEGHKQKAAIAWTIRLRRREDISAKHRVLWGSRILSIRSVVSDIPRADLMELVCTEYIQ